MYPLYICVLILVLVHQAYCDTITKEEARAELAMALDETPDADRDKRKVTVHINQEIKESETESYLATFDATGMENAVWSHKVNIDQVVKQLEAEGHPDDVGHQKTHNVYKDKMMKGDDMFRKLNPEFKEFNVLGKGAKADATGKYDTEPVLHFEAPTSSDETGKDISESQDVLEAQAQDTPTEAPEKEVSEILSNEPTAAPIPVAPPKTLACTGWRQTGACSPDGPREPEFDQKCVNTVSSAWSGYCECAGGIKRAMVGCNHVAFKCIEICSSGDLHLIPAERPALEGIVKEMDEVFAKSIWTPLDQHNAHEFVYHRPILPFIMLLKCDCPRDAMFAEVLPDLDLALAPYKGKIRFLSQSRTISHAFGSLSRYSLTADMLPTLVSDYLPVGATIEKSSFPINKQFNVDDIVQYVEDAVITRVAPLVIKSETSPKEDVYEKGVLKVTASSFDEQVIQNSKAVLIMVYGATCSASRAIMPLVEQVAATIAASEDPDLKDIVIAKMDHQLNDLPHGHLALRHYPTLYLYPADNKKNGVLSFDDFNGSKLPHDTKVPHSHYDAHSILEFLLSHRDTAHIKSPDHANHHHHEPQ